MPNRSLIAILFKGFSCGLLACLVQSSASAQSYNDIPECQLLVEQTKRVIDESRDCKEVDECGLAGFGCPFGCGSAVRRDAIEKLKKLEAEFNQRCPGCDYRCAQVMRQLKCIDSKCVLVPVK